MKSWFKKATSLILAVLMTLSFASCKKDDQNANNNISNLSSDSGATDGNPYKDPMKITVALWGVGDMIVDGSDKIRDEIYQKFNITIEPYAVTWNDYIEKIRVWAATKKLPDITAVDIAYTDSFSKWSKEGVVRALPKDLSKYPNIKKILDTPDAKRMNEIKQNEANPVFYSIPRPSVLSQEEGILDTGIAIRKDWMQNVGVTKVPETLDEFIDLLKKFQTEDPDKNGKPDTLGLCGYDFAYMTQIFGSKCPSAINGYGWMFKEDGSLIPSFMTDQFLSAVKDLKKVYDAGVIDKDYILYKGDDGRNKFYSGKAGAYAHGGPALGAMELIKNGFKQSYPDKKFEDLVTYVPWFPNEKGEYLYKGANLYWSETYLGHHVSDAKAERCMAFMDYLLSDEGYNLLGLGYEGVDYNKDSSGKITLIDTKKSDGSIKAMGEKYPASQLLVLAHWTGFRSLSSPAYSDGLKQIRNDFMKFHKDKGAKIANDPITQGLHLEKTKELNNANDNYRSDINELMISKDIDAAFKKMVDKYMKSGYDKVIKEMNDLYKASGR